MKIIAEIPARAGSKRVKNKNLRILAGKPLIEYAIDAAKKSNLIDDIYVNSDSDEIGQFGISKGIKYYKRSKELSGDLSTSDDYNYDFFINVKPDILIQINPVCPFVNSNLINNSIKYYLEKKIDTLISVKEERLQAFCADKPINFDIDKPLPRTQDINPVLICSWPVSIWRKETFINNYLKKGHAVFSGNVGFFKTSFAESIKISYEEDFKLAENLMSLI